MSKPPSISFSFQSVLAYRPLCKKTILSVLALSKQLVHLHQPRNAGRFGIGLVLKVVGKHHRLLVLLVSFLQFRGIVVSLLD